MKVMRRARASIKKTLGRSLTALSSTGIPKLLIDTVESKDRNRRLSRKFEGSFIGLSLRTADSESLERGKYFVKIVISRWANNEGEYFRVFCDGQQIYGNVIERPASGGPCIYRNIVGSSPDPDSYTVAVDSPYSVEVSPYQFRTKDQAVYDAKFEIKRHGNLFYSLRGNTENPKRLIVTFPGFTVLASSINYTVSYLKDLTAEDLKECAILAFQDRYQVPGSYMMFDSSGRSIQEDVSGLIRSLLAKWKVEQKDLLLFGASKGATCAIYYAEPFPAAHIVVSTPQLNLPYYFTKPPFRENFFVDESYRELTEPGELLHRYVTEGRNIDYFYTNDDELSNHSSIEFAFDVRNTILHRIPGVHTAVARKALPTMTGIFRRFARGVTSCRNIETTLEAQTRLMSNLLSVRIEVPSARLESVDQGNWYLERQQPRRRFEIDVTQDGILETTPQQFLNPVIDDLSGQWSVLWLGADGDSQIYPVQMLLPELPEPDRRLVSPNTIDVSGSTAVHSILSADRLCTFSYKAQRADGKTHVLRIGLVDDVNGFDLSSISDGSQWAVALNPIQAGELIEAALLRFIAVAGAYRVEIFVQKTLADEALTEKLSKFRWKSLVLDTID